MLKLTEELYESCSRDSMVLLALKSALHELGSRVSNPETTKMTHILDLPQELLNTILTLLVVSSSGAMDWARVSATCKSFRAVSIETNVLRAINCPSVEQVGHCESLHHINGVLSRCVRAENPSADYFLAKAILAGGTQLWKTISENNLKISSIKSTTALPLFERCSMAKSLITGSIADLPYILFSLEDEPDLRKSYRRMHHLRLVRSFILLVNLQEFIPIRNVVKDFMAFFVGRDKYHESGIDLNIMRMCWYECIRGSNIKIPNGPLADFLLLRLPVGHPSYREQVTLGLEKLLQQEALTY